MRVSPAIGMSLMILLMGSSGVLGSDCKRQTNSSPTSTSPSFLSEFRFGFSAQDPWGAGGRDGSANLTGEILFAKPFTASDLFTSYFIPRPHVGGSLNFDGQTSFAYAGLSWTVDVTPDAFRRGQPRRCRSITARSTRSPGGSPAARLLAAVSRIGLGGRAAVGQLERDGHYRAPVECRRLLGRESRLDQCRRAGWVYVLSASCGKVTRFCAKRCATGIDRHPAMLTKPPGASWSF